MKAGASVEDVQDIDCFEGGEITISETLAGTAKNGPTRCAVIDPQASQEDTPATQNTGRY